MMLCEEEQDEQEEGAIVLIEAFQPPTVVNVDVSEDLFSTFITREKKTLNIGACASAGSDRMGAD